MHKLGNITFDNISETQFDNFLDALKHADEVEYNQEGKDGFVDLYNYWNNVSHERGGMRRFNEKMINNKNK